MIKLLENTCTKGEFSEDRITSLNRNIYKRRFLTHKFIFNYFYLTIKIEILSEYENRAIL